MTSESLNSSLLGNGVKQVAVDMYTHNTRRSTVSMQRRGKHPSVKIEELFGSGVFYVVRAEML
jgi:hypothetical protein